MKLTHRKGRLLMGETARMCPPGGRVRGALGCRLLLLLFLNLLVLECSVFASQVASVVCI